MFTKHDSRNTQVSYFWLPENSWRPFHWCIIYYCRTDINEAKVISAQVKIQFKIQYRPFWKEIQIFGFPCCSTRENLSIDVSITNVGLILTKLRWFQLFSTSQSTSTIKKVFFFCFLDVVLVKTFPLMYQ